jgi:hypothetical protein
MAISKEIMEDNLISDFIKGKLKTETPSETTLFAEEKGNSNPRNEPLQFSDEATAVFVAGRGCQLVLVYARQL